MALNIIRQVTRFSYRGVINSIPQRFYSLYEPDYLQTGKSKIPCYSTLNLKITGQTYSVLESYQSYVYKICLSLDIDVEDSWALPPKELKIQKFKKGTTLNECEYKLNYYERNIQISDLSSTKCSILVRLLEAILPEGMSLNIDIFDPMMEQKRYIPDKELLDLKTELANRTKS